MKRGENGSSNVSMGPLKASGAVIILVARSLFQSCNNDVHDIWRTGHGYDNASRLRLPNSPPINQSVTWLAIGWDATLLHCNVSCANQWLCGRSSWGMPLCSRPLLESQASVLSMARAM